MLNWKDSPEIVAGIFDSAMAARQAIVELRAKHFAEDQIGLLTPPAKGNFDPALVEAGSEVATGATVGAAAGAGLGIGWGIAVATGVLPIAGPVVAGGIMTSALIGALGGGTIAR